jgi:thioredoxin-related protein
MHKFILLTLIFIHSLSGAPLAGIHWEADFATALKTAQTQNKPILFVYSRHTCKYCVLLEKTTFKDPTVIKALTRDYVSVVSYTDENDYTPRDLETPGTPALWFLKPSGEPLFQPIMGAVDAENFLRALAIVKEEFDTLQKNGK